MFGAVLLEGKQRVSQFYRDLGLDLVGLIGNSLLVVGGGRSRQESPHPFRRSAQTRYGRQGCGRSAGGSAGDKG